MGILDVNPPKMTGLKNVKRRRIIRDHLVAPNQLKVKKKKV